MIVLKPYRLVLLISPPFSLSLLTLFLDEKTNNVALRRLLATIDGPIDRMVRQLAGFEDRLIGLRKVRKGVSLR